MLPIVVAAIFNLTGWLIIAVAVVGLFGSLRWFAAGPSPRTRARVEQVLRAKNLKLIDLKPRPEPRIGMSSSCLLVARTEDAFGDERREYFEVDVWADIFTRNPSIREIAPPQGPVRATSAGD